VDTQRLLVVITKNKSSAVEFKITDSRYLIRSSLYVSISSLIQLCERLNSVVDVGSGYAPYQTLFKECLYLRIDLNPHKSVDVIASAGFLPLKSECFDAVVCTQMLMYVKEPTNVIRELYRILTTNGYLILSAAGVWYEEHEPGFSDLWRWTLNGLSEIISKSGFEIVAHQSMDPYSSFLQLLILYFPFKLLIPFINCSLVSKILEKLLRGNGPKIHLMHVILAKKAPSS